MMKEAEDIIVSKSFFELTEAERSEVLPYASSEEEYEEMKWFLLNTRAAFSSTKIEPDTSLKSRVFSTLDAAQKEKGGIIRFLFPGGAFYKQPILQLGLVAALVLGVFFIYDGQEESFEVAQNGQNQPVEEISIIADSVISNEEVPLEDKSLEENENSAEAEVSPVQSAHSNERSVKTEKVEEDFSMVVDEEVSVDAIEISPAPLVVDNSVTRNTTSSAVVTGNTSESQLNSREVAVKDNADVSLAKKEANEQKKDESKNKEGDKYARTELMADDVPAESPATETVTFTSASAGGSFSYFDTDSTTNGSLNGVGAGAAKAQRSVAQSKELKNLFFNIK